MDFVILDCSFGFLRPNYIYYQLERSMVKRMEKRRQHIKTYPEHMIRVNLLPFAYVTGSHRYRNVAEK